MPIFDDGQIKPNYVQKYDCSQYYCCDIEAIKSGMKGNYGGLGEWVVAHFEDKQKDNDKIGASDDAILDLSSFVKRKDLLF